MATQLLQKQTALVTGAATGIGAATAQALAAAGAAVLVNYYSNADAARKTVEAIERAGGQAQAFQADVSREDEVEQMFAAACREFGTLDILVANAGIQQDAALTEMSLTQWSRVIETNLTGAFLCARAAAREFLRRGSDPARSKATGKIIFTSSVHEKIPWAGHANYAASKGGLMLFMQTIAQELAPWKIRVNSIAPGAIKTPINRSAWETEQAKNELRQLIPYGRIGEVVDIAKAMVWLASDEADYITGTSLVVDGGMLLYPGFRNGG